MRTPYWSALMSRANAIGSQPCRPILYHLYPSEYALGHDSPLVLTPRSQYQGIHDIRYAVKQWQFRRRTNSGVAQTGRRSAPEPPLRGLL